AIEGVSQVEGDVRIVRGSGGGAAEGVRRAQQIAALIRLGRLGEGALHLGGAGCRGGEGSLGRSRFATEESRQQAGQNRSERAIPPHRDHGGEGPREPWRRPAIIPEL